MVDNDRASKARKIESIIRHYLEIDLIRGKKILDIGCGNGEIISHFAADNDVYGCDVNNQLSSESRAAIHFERIGSTLLPYEDKSFDVVITNHVIEHVDDQLNHLKEISRVLKDDGLCFFSTPNRFFPVEPHYSIPLIHYLPNFIFTSLLVRTGKYHEELKLLTHCGMHAVCRDAGFEAHEYTAMVLKYPEQFHWDGPSLKLLPLWMVRWLQVFSQTNIFVLTKADQPMRRPN